MFLRKDITESRSNVRKSHCPVGLTNCTLKRSLKAVLMRNWNIPDPKALLWMTNRRSRCLQEIRSYSGLIRMSCAFEDGLEFTTSDNKFRHLLWQSNGKFNRMNFHNVSRVLRHNNPWKSGVFYMIIVFSLLNGAIYTDNERSGRSLSWACDYLALLLS